MDKLFLIWVTIGLVSSIVEFRTKKLLWIWIAVGSIAGVIANLLNCVEITQVCVFILVTLLSDILLYNTIYKWIHKGEIVEENDTN